MYVGEESDRALAAGYRIYPVPIPIPYHTISYHTQTEQAKPPWLDLLLGVSRAVCYVFHGL